MAMAQLLEFRGGAAEQWHALHQVVAPDGKLAAGALFHVGGPINGGWRVVNIWESEDASQTFFPDRLMPVLQERGLPGPESVSWWPVGNVMM